MKILILLLFVVALLTAKITTISTTKITDIKRNTATVLCVDGYRYLLIKVRGYSDEIQLTQMYRANEKHGYETPQPIRCK